MNRNEAEQRMRDLREEIQYAEDLAVQHRSLMLAARARWDRLLAEFHRLGMEHGIELWVHEI